MLKVKVTKYQVNHNETSDIGLTLSDGGPDEMYVSMDETRELWKLLNRYFTDDEFRFKHIRVTEE